MKNKEGRISEMPLISFKKNGVESCSKRETDKQRQTVQEEWRRLVCSLSAPWIHSPYFSTLLCALGCWQLWIAPASFLTLLLLTGFNHWKKGEFGILIPHTWCLSGWPWAASSCEDHRATILEGSRALSLLLTPGYFSILWCFPITLGRQSSH